jgi:hypothetical protein
VLCEGWAKATEWELSGQTPVRRKETETGREVWGGVWMRLCCDAQESAWSGEKIGQPPLLLRAQGRRSKRQKQVWVWIRRGFVAVWWTLKQQKLNQRQPKRKKRQKCDVEPALQEAEAIGCVSAFVGSDFGVAPP